MIPKKGEYFRVEHKGIDKSWRGDIFLCSASDEGLVVCEMVSRDRNIYDKKFNFAVSEWDFFTVSSEVLEANGITINKEIIMAKTKADLYREWARVLDMCEGTEVSPNICVSYMGDISDRKVNLGGDPNDYEFAVAILEDKPVFVGDKVYANNCTSPLIVGGISKQKGCIFVGNCINYDISILSWNPPKKTFLLNGVELPCPDSNGNWAFMFGNSRVYKFKTQDNRDKVSQAIIKILDEASI